MATASPSLRPGRARKGPLSKRPFVGVQTLFCAVIIDRDGNERIEKYCLTPVAAAKYVGGFIASQAHNGSYAEAREIDLSSIRLTGRTLGAADLVAASSRSAANHGGDSNNGM